MKGYAPGWEIRCTNCGKTRDAGDVGAVRIGASSKGKRTLGWCSGCKWFRFLAIEEKVESATG